MHYHISEAELVVKTREESKSGEWGFYVSRASGLHPLTVIEVIVITLK